MEKLLNVQELERYSKDGFIKILKASYKNKVENNLTHITESSDSKLERFSPLYDNSNMPCFLNTNFSKVKRSLIAKLRLSCHSLNIETMRYCRHCPFFPDVVESEEHSLLHYKKYDSLRKTVNLYQKLCTIWAKGLTLSSISLTHKPNKIAKASLIL